MVRKMNQDVASFLLKCQLPSQPDQVRRAPSARPAAAPRVQTSKQGVQNLNEQRIAAARAQAGAQGRPGAGGGAGVPGVPPPPKPTQPIRSEKKYGRNDLVTIRRGSEVQELKYKKAEALLTEGWQIQEDA